MAADALSLRIAPRSVERLHGWAKRCRAWSFGTRCGWRMTSVARTAARASRTGVGGRPDNLLFFRPKRPAASSSSQSTTSSTVSALPQADRR
eukprot:COSAG06_NODE_3173_length_5735_cov_131.450142_6_plen_92_part_00